MPTVTIHAHEGESLTVRVQTEKETNHTREVIKTAPQQVGLLPAKGKAKPQPIMADIPALETVTEKVTVWTDERIDTFASERRQYEVGPGRRIIVEGGKL